MADVDDSEVTAATDADAGDETYWAGKTESVPDCYSARTLRGHPRGQRPAATFIPGLQIRSIGNVMKFRSRAI